MTLFGCDLSDYDRQRGPVDVAAMARDGISFLSHKATEGTSITHKYYAQTLNDARAAGISLLGAYMVVRTPGNGGAGSIGAQVSYLLSYLDGQTPWWRSEPGFFIQVDLERWSYDSVAPAYGAQAAQLLRTQTGHWVVEYASKGQYADSLASPAPLWNANYPTWSSTLGRCPAAPYRQAYANSGGDSGPGWATYSGQTPVFWQFSDNATIGGQPGCDADAFRGSLDELHALITGGTDMRTTDYGVAGIDKYTTDDLVAALILNYDPEGAQGRPGINGLQQTLAAIKDAVGKVQAGAAPTQDQVNTAVLAAMKDPTVQAGIGAAIAQHLHVS